MTNDVETWKPASGEPSYLISSEGRVIRIEKTVRCGPGGTSLRVLPQREIYPYLCKQTGYQQATLDGHRKRNLHRVMAMTFLGPPPSPSSHVNHKDGNRANNSLSNLEWCTPAENARHAYRVLGRVNPFTSKFGADHPTSKAIVLTHIASGVAERFDSGCDASRKYPQLRSDGLSRAGNGLQASHKGFKVAFVAMHCEETV